MVAPAAARAAARRRPGGGLGRPSAGPPAGPPAGGPPGASTGGQLPPGLFGGTGTTQSGGGLGGAGAARGAGFGPGGGAGGFGGGAFGGDSASLTAALGYAKTHGGGTVAVESQSSAAAAILSSDGNVAGIGGFSGRESSVTPAWLAMEVKLGRLRWVVTGGGQGPRLRGDTRAGSQDAISIVEKACKAVTVQTTSGASATMYDCQGRASAILAAARG